MLTKKNYFFPEKARRMKSIYPPSLSLMLICLLISLSAQATETAAIPKKSSGILLDNMDKSISPGDDFFSYVNGRWLDKTEIPADKSSFGNMRILHEQSVADIKSIIEDTAEGEFTLGSDEQKVGDMFNAFMDTEQRDSLGIDPLKPELAKIDAIKNVSELIAYFAYANKLGYGSPLAVFQYPNLKEPTRYAIYTWHAGLTLPDKEYYLKTDEQSKALQQKYLQYVESMLLLIGIADAKDAALDVYNLEKSIAALHMDKEKTRDMIALYNDFKVGDFAELSQVNDWQPYLETAELGAIKNIIVTDVNYITALDKLVSNTSLTDWKIYLKWHLLSANAKRLTTEIARQQFLFFGKEMAGVPKQQALWRRGVNVVNQTLGEVVGKVYVKRHFSAQAKQRMLLMVNNLLRAYKQSIADLEWMSDKTKAEAFKKLSKFTTKIGYPDKWHDYSKLDIDKNDLFGNFRRAAFINYQFNLDRLYDEVDRTEWSTTPQTVNAYYNATMNEIIFPAAILQFPYFDLSVDDAVNYGAIGAIIGHEIGHGFDDVGSAFDGDGVLRNWWQASDKLEFKERTKKLISQYDNFEVFDDLKVNGVFTLGENIGDLGGLAITLKAYDLSLSGEPAPVLDGFTGKQRVFIGYAQAWMYKSRELAMRQRIATDPHSPPKYRVNGVVRNIPEFYSVFDVKPTDALYLAPEDRVKIW